MFDRDRRRKENMQMRNILGVFLLTQAKA